MAAVIDVTSDSDGLDRFVAAQADNYATALAELTAGRKTSHWMWFVFPQIAGLGQSAMARRYAIVDMAEARDYLAHPVLGPRLADCARAVLSWSGRRSAEHMLGDVDAVKLRSSATLFEAAGGAPPFFAILDSFFDGVRDPATLRRL